MSVEHRFDIPFIASMAHKEKQIQQNYRPIIAVHKWFARRPGTLFRALVLAEFADRRLDETFFVGHDFKDKVVADPFMGGGIPLIEANRVGCDVIGFDINPMSSWIVREEIEHIDHDKYRNLAKALVSHLDSAVGNLYRTDCPHYGDCDVPVKYFLWVKTIPCERCRENIDLFPGYLIADDTRHPQNVLVCANCGALNETHDVKVPGRCRGCRKALRLNGPATRNRCPCPHCGQQNAYPRSGLGPPAHRLFAIEYYNPKRRSEHKGRFFKKPDQKDLELVDAADSRWARIAARFVPDQEIPSGDETDRLHRWGYNKYKDLFNPRQLLALELSCRDITAIEDARIKRALATNLSDLLRYQNMLCRYDTMALKSLDIFSVHGFPIGLVQCESNFIGITNDAGANVGSGGWRNIIDKYAKAKLYCDAPFEVQHQHGRKVQVAIPGEWIGEKRDGARSRNVALNCVSSTVAELAPASLDAVFTDPPYFGNVQYAELMDFCYVWLRQLVRDRESGFDRVSTRAPDELTANATVGRGLVHFTEGLSLVFMKMAAALKPGCPLAFTYHHNKIEPYYSAGIAMLDAGLTCSASLPCPAEMGGSIHIHGTGSSIVDTIFVCRASGTTKRSQLFASTADLAQIVRDDIGQLRLAGVKATLGDIRCVVFGHLTRMAVWKLRSSWDSHISTATKIERFSSKVREFGPYDTVIDILTAPQSDRIAPPADSLPLFLKEERDAVAF